MSDSFLLKFLKDRFDSEEEEGFPDMNYQIGATTGKDIGGEPNVLHRRMGRFAQLGASTLEVLIDNPATFQVEREEIMNVLERLDLDASFHGDANIGWTAAYATRGTGFQGFEVVHRYFTRYLHQLAYFKKTIDESEKYSSNLSYVNMHASVAELPALEEQIASDKSLDPFGESIDEVNGDKKHNIYENEDFMALLFEYLFKDEFEEIYRYYGEPFGSYCSNFKEDWREAQEEVVNEIFRNETDGIDDPYERAQRKAGVLETASRQDPGSGIEFSEEARNRFDDLPDPIQNRLQNLNLRTLADTLLQLRNVIDQNDQIEANEVWEPIIDLLDDFWYEGSGIDEGLSYKGKLTGIVNRFDRYDKEYVQDQANTEDMEEKAKKVFSGNEDYWGDDYQQGEIPGYLKLFNRFIDNTRLGRQMEKESTVYYNIIPAWMQTVDEDKFPEIKFMWEAIVERKWDDSEIDFEDYKSFSRALSEKREFRLDVTAAVGAAYMWGHFTQVKNDFEAQEKSQYTPELRGGMDEARGWNWVRWLNKHDFGVNIEMMYGDPGRLVRLWRPKDIVVACRAINRTARRQCNRKWEEDWNGNPVMFTIDIEHTGSFGVDPEEEMKRMIEQEKELAGTKTDADPRKPLADILKTYHLTRPGYEQTGGVGHRHGPFARGDTLLYRYLYRLVEAGFARGDETGIVMFEIGGEYKEEIYVTRIAMDLISLGVTPEELDPANVPVDGNYENEREALMARFFGMDESSINMEWAKIEEHAFDPLKGLLESEQFDYTWSSSAALQNDNRADEWQQEEYR